MLDPQKEFSWLGAEALPGGLAEINGAIQARAEGAILKQQIPRQELRPAGLIAIAARWMGKSATIK